jgi:16S rRNA (uracil1498-N3)-methyltransferase
METPQRRLRRFFSSAVLNKEGQEITLPPSEASHMHKTLRLSAGDRCLVTDGYGREAEARIKGFSQDGSALLVIGSISRLSSSGSGNLMLNVYPALLQKGKLDDLVQKAQELGIQKIFPVETRRTVAKMTPEARKKVMGRWEKIAREAAKQSGSLRLTEIHEPAEFKKAVQGLPAGSQIALFHPTEKMSFPEWIKTVKPEKEIHLFFGPEGGFEDAEVEWAISKGAVVVGLGDILLKADTAFYGVTAALKFLFL